MSIANDFFNLLNLLKTFQGLFISYLNYNFSCAHEKCWLLINLESFLLNRTRIRYLFVNKTKLFLFTPRPTISGNFPSWQTVNPSSCFPNIFLCSIGSVQIIIHEFSRIQTKKEKNKKQKTKMKHKNLHPNFQTASYNFHSLRCGMSHPFPEFPPPANGGYFGDRLGSRLRPFTSQRKNLHPPACRCFYGFTRTLACRTHAKGHKFPPRE